MRHFLGQEKVLLAVAFLALSAGFYFIGSIWVSGLCVGGTIVCLVMFAVQLQDSAQRSLNRSGRHYFDGKFYDLVEQGDHQQVVEALEQNIEWINRMRAQADSLLARVRSAKPGMFVDAKDRRIH